jgi:hypothetical protein
MSMNSTFHRDSDQNSPPLTDCTSCTKTVGNTRTLAGHSSLIRKPMHDSVSIGDKHNSNSRLVRKWTWFQRSTVNRIFGYKRKCCSSVVLCVLLGIRPMSCINKYVDKGQRLIWCIKYLFEEFHSL